MWNTDKLRAPVDPKEPAQAVVRRRIGVVQMKDDILLAYAMRFVGLPYLWGGDDPIKGYDCSGLVLELLKSVGKTPHTLDVNAQGLFRMFYKQGAITINPSCGDLAFYGKDNDNVTHVGMCVDSSRVIEAGGGGSKTTTTEAAAQQNAYIRLRPIRYRKDFLCVLMI